MSDFDFEELDQAINDLYAVLDDDNDDADDTNAGANVSTTKDDNNSNDGANNDSKGIHSDDSLSTKEIDNNSEDIKPANATGTASSTKRRRVMDIAPVKKAQTVDIDSANTESASDVEGVANSKAGGAKGHFMDMVHPSSDASVQRKPNFAAERQREIDAIEEKQAKEEIEPKKPNKIAVIADDGDEDDNDNDNDKKDAAKSTKAITVVDDADSDDQNTPVITATSSRRVAKYTNANRRTPRDLAQPMSVTDLRPLTPDEIKGVNPNETPFLPDAKVNKRPLGDGSVRPIKESNNKRRAEIEDEVDDIVSDLVAGKQSANNTSRRRYARNASSVKTGHKAKKTSVARIIGWILLFIAVTALGALAGFVLYYLMP